MDTLCNKPQKQILTIFSFLFLSLIINVNSLFAQADGEKIFKQNCAVCHSLGSEMGTGPGLEGVASRVKGGKAWFMKWIKNNKAFIDSGDPYAKQIKEKYKTDMTLFNNFTDDELNAVIAYITNPPKKIVDPTKPPGGGDPATAPTEQGVSPMAILIGVIAFLIIIVGVLRGVTHSLKNVQNEKQNLPEEEAVGPWKELKTWMGKNKRTVAVIVLFLLGGVLSATWDALMGIGVYEGYHPTQPIAFSHKIHAGDNAINCQYCHSGVERSKTAGIPTVNVCMNCHKGIKKGPTTGETEIAKIYDAAGWDPKANNGAGGYTKPQKPIQWVKVHNLPDFVFFSHQQHVKVGKQECATCHGDVPKMTTVQQEKPLTMGWCIDCHRKTEVPGMKDNAYYESFHKNIVNSAKFKNLPKEQQIITVDKMGGIECAKCHY